MDSRPLFVDNRDGNTLDLALRHYLGALRAKAGDGIELSIASAYFNVAGFRLIADELARAKIVKLLLGAEPVPESVRPPRKPGDRAEPAATEEAVAVALRALETGLRRERDLLPFDAEADRAVRELTVLLHSGKIEVRRYARHFLHAKAFLFRVQSGGVIVGSSNLTSGGLRGNLELDLAHYDDQLVARVGQWFDELWSGAEPFNLAAMFDELMAEFSPYLIYLRVLFELYKDDLLGDEIEDGKPNEIPLTSFQQHGVLRARRLLRRYGGVLVADGVGLGKTFMAGEIVRQYRERRQRVLLICPASLRDSTWADFLDRFQLFAECVSFEQLARDRQLSGDESHLKHDVAEYALVVVDEAHNYRNPDAPARAGVLRRLLLGQRRDLLLLTATPVNNSLWDLYHLLRYFIKQDAVLADHGVLSIRDRFENAARVDPFNLNPDLLYPVIDATTVKRTRQFVKKHYANDLIRMPDGKLAPIHFPKPVASTIDYELDAVLPGFLDRLEEALVPDGAPPLVKMARYKPENYPKGSAANTADPTIVALLRSSLLKRFESSVHAFAKSCKKMVREHDLFLEALDRGVVVRKDVMHELAAADDEDAVEEILEATENSEPANRFNVAALRADVTTDRNLLDELGRVAGKIAADDDPKLRRLVDELSMIASDAEKEGVSEEDRRRKRKVLVFSYFADTVDWIAAFLDRALESDPRLRAFRSRVATVAGAESRNGVTREDAVFGFAPETTNPPPDRGQDRFDLLVTTDVLAEGMNLQQCRNIVNYDLPWNPMRLVQRHGRVDRIGSPHDRVFLRTFFPDDALDRLLALERRVRRKLAQAAASVGVEVAPIEHGSERDQSFADTDENIEKLRNGDASIYDAGGTASAAQTGEEYRQELRKALRAMGDRIERLPWKAGSGLAKGKRRGHFFCARIGERVFVRFVPFERTSGSTANAKIERELGLCLRLLECEERTPRVMPLDLKQTAFSAWEIALADIYAAWTYETDPKHLQPKVSRFSQELAKFLRDHPPVGMAQTRVDRCLDAIEAPYPKREENALRGVFGNVFASASAKAHAIVEEVERLGLEPFQAPSPLPSISRDEIHLICWMGVEAVT